MDLDTSWQAFACTGNIYRYLDYKKQGEPPAPADTGKEEPNGSVCDFGAGAKRNTI